MHKVTGLDEWDVSEVAEEAQVAEVSVFATYPGLSDGLLRQAPAERLKTIAQQIRAELDTVLATGKLANWKLLKNTGRNGRYYAVRGNIKVLDIPALADLEVVASIRVETINGKKRRKRKAAKKKLSYYCIKMTVAIQIEGHTTGMQTVEERYVLYRAYSEADAIAKAKEAAPAYGKPYLNSTGELVRWMVESIDSVYEMVPDKQQTLDGAEVFSTLKTRKFMPERAWF